LCYGRKGIAANPVLTARAQMLT